MDRRSELCQGEKSEWRKLHGLLEPLSDEELQDPTLTPEGWSPKDMMFHVGAWAADCARQLERMRLGTWQEPVETVDATNAEWFQLSRTLGLDTVRGELMAGRNRMIQEFGALLEVTPEAQEWFSESGEIHYRNHAADLGSWLGGRSA
jgi:hypothetical protein